MLTFAANRFFLFASSTFYTRRTCPVRPASVRGIVARASIRMSSREGTNSSSVSSLRVDYSSRGLIEDDISGVDPITLFDSWLQDAIHIGEHEPNAMCLATAGVDARPSARMVLLKGVDNRGFVWYTNYGSRKATELTENPAAALTFWWPRLERSVRVQGDVSRTSPDESTHYFNSRPIRSRLGAIASDQSRPVSGREPLENRMRLLETDYLNSDDHTELVKDIERPDSWGGFRLVPSHIEFWKGRPSRLHDRILFTRNTSAESWSLQRLQP